jgi:DNA invertase Pin-like site-specific DNA recombinase
MAHRAVIYVRTSSESQAEKSSLVEQEVDCRRLAQENGLTVVRVYQDSERYRAKMHRKEKLVLSRCEGL